MTPEQFAQQEQHLLDWYHNANSAQERQAAVTTLNNLHQMMQSQIRFEANPEPKKRKPRRKLTEREKFDRKNSRRQAILDQRQRREQSV